MNKVILSGNLARDPDVRVTSTQKTVARMTLAVQRGWKKAEGQPTADFFNITAWERTAEFCRNYLTKGSRIIVEGRLTTNTYDAKDGTKRYVTEVVANEIEFAGAKQQRPADDNNSDPFDAMPSNPSPDAPSNDDDFPF